MSTAKKILGNTIVQVAGRGVMAVASVVVLKVITGFLSVDGYGQYTAVFEFLAFFGIVADLGLFTIAVREMGKESRDRNFIVGNILGMRMGLAAVSMAVAVLVAFLLPQYQDSFIPGGIAVASMAVFLSIMHGTVSSVLQVELKMQYATVGLVLGKLISLAWMLAVIFWFFADAPGSAAFYQLILAGVVGNLFAFGYTFYYAAKFANIRPQFEAKYWREIMTTAVPYGLALVLNMIYFRIDSIMILFIKGPTELGYYAPAMRILEILSVIPVYFMNSVLPVLSRAVKEAPQKALRVLQLAGEFLFMIALPIVIGLYLLAYPLIFLIAQPEFLSQLDKGIYGSDVALQLLVFAMFFAFLNSMFSYSLVATNKQNHLLWINGSAALVNIVANGMVIPVWGFRGAAYTSIFTEAYILIMAFLVARQFFKYRFDWRPFAKSTFAAAVMGVTVYFLKEPTYHFLGMENLNVLLLSFLGALIYGSLLLLMKAIPSEFMEGRRFFGRAK